MYVVCFELGIQQLLQFPRLMRRMRIIVATQMLSLDKDIGNSALSRHLLQSGLYGVAVGHLIQFVYLMRYFEALKELFGGSAIRTIRFGPEVSRMNNKLL